jgi:hypothetical protein
VTWPATTWPAGAHWPSRVRSIALGLEALRAVDRYGLTHQGEQYTPWKAIGSGPTPMPSNGAMTGQQVASLMATLGDPHGLIVGLDQGLIYGRLIEATYKKAVRQAHLGHGGSGALFQRLQDVKRVLDGGVW